MRRADGRDEMTVRCEVRGIASDGLRRAYEDLLRARLGVEVRVELCAPGALVELTEVDKRQKPIRLRDLRV